MAAMFFLGMGLLVVCVMGGFWYLEKRHKRLSSSDCRRCGHCGYDLNGHENVIESQGSKCPECGRLFSDVQPVLPNVPHPKFLATRRERVVLYNALLGGVCGSYLICSELKRTQTLDWPGIIILVGAVIMPCGGAFWLWQKRA